MSKKSAKHMGEVLKKAVDLSGLPKAWVAKQAHYERATYYTHISNPDLPMHVLRKYADVEGVDLTEYFPKSRAGVQDEELVYNNKRFNEVLAENNFLRTRVEELQKHNETLTKMVTMLEEKLESLTAPAKRRSPRHP